MIFVREIHFKSTDRSVHSPLSITSTCQYTANIGLAYMQIRMTILIVARFVGEPSSRVATRLTQRGITRQSSQQSVSVAAAAAASDCSAVDEVRYVIIVVVVVDVAVRRWNGSQLATTV